MLVHDYVEYWGHRAPDRMCVADDTRSWSFAEVDRRANQFAHALVGLGVGDGDRFAVLAKNCVEWAVIYAGAFKAGAVPVPLNYRHHPREWIHPIEDSGAAVLIGQQQYAEAVEGIRDLAPKLRELVLLDADRDGWRRLEDLTEHAATSRPGAPIAADHVLYQMYTSGTTGKPKGALLTHRAADANMTQIRTALSLHHETKNMLVMPLFHTASAVNLFAGWSAGLSAHIVVDFDPEECARFIDDKGITLASFAPAMIQAMLVRSTSIHQRGYRALEKILYGASAINEETLRRALGIFDCDFYQAYGQTEATAALTMLGPEDHRLALAGQPSLLRSCGRPVVGTDIRIVGADGNEVAAGEIGEICARGPQVMSGYANLPAESARALADGWLHTGDAGYFDASGFLYVSDRIKDMIVSGAENVFPKEIEDVLYELDGVAEAAVIGVPSRRWGEAVKAVVVPTAAATLTEDSVITWCRGRLAGYKCPKSVDFAAELPRNAAGKVLKRALREPYWRDQVRQVG